MRLCIIGYLSCTVTDKGMPFLSVFIPAYNEELNLPHSISVIQTKLEECGIDYEILVVNDGSTDRTGVIADELTKSQPKIHVVHHVHNAGIGAGFVTAVQHAHGEWLILIPSDLALAPEDIKRYLDAAPTSDLVVGLRSDRSDYTLARRIVSWTNIKLVQTLFGTTVKQFQYISMYRTSFLRAIDIEYWQSAFFHAEIILKGMALGRRITEVEIQYAPRLSGKATGAKFKLIALTVRDIFRFWLKWILLGPIQASSKINHPERRTI